MTTEERVKVLEEIVTLQSMNLDLLEELIYDLYAKSVPS